ncbi:MAG: pyridoxal-phosphate dependent enzyme [Chlamydiia bacterium]|nr:pyridoxal-phosphate dependent enzyme [Chlamydiia bacterium]
MSSPLTLELIAQAKNSIKDRILQTPLEPSKALSELLQTEVCLKLENFQTTGSFKVRGAFFYLSTCKESECRQGVAACSAGNHGLGVAFAAQKMGIPCTVYVPQGVDQSKYEKILQLGATVFRSQFVGYDDTLVWAQQDAKQKGLHFITAFDDERIMAGNGGTLAMEILDACPDVKNVVFPVGGGGLGAGLSFYLKEKNPSIRLIGCQHINSPALKLSLERQKAVTVLPAIDTVACGVEGGIGEKCFEILKNRIDDVILLSEEEIYDAFIWQMHHYPYLIEPTAAVTLAACLSKKIPCLQGKTVVLFSGSNVSKETIDRITFQSLRHE